MLGKDSKFMKMTAKMRQETYRRKSSDILNAAKSVYGPAPKPFPDRNEWLNQRFSNIYWSFRKLQFQLFFKNEGWYKFKKKFIYF
ncbi:unnamed protein product [Meloidogyne enterolobii]|uniref:Uncharacterized protein n=1 Tax=Meloidogyne enterolobii TaxID=390850 RepID=A0ACB0XMI3_MELEN